MKKRIIKWLSILSPTTIPLVATVSCLPAYTDINDVLMQIKGYQNRIHMGYNKYFDMGKVYDFVRFVQWLQKDKSYEQEAKLYLKELNKTVRIINSTSSRYSKLSQSQWLNINLVNNYLQRILQSDLYRHLERWYGNVMVNAVAIKEFKYSKISNLQPIFSDNFKYFTDTRNIKEINLLNEIKENKNNLNLKFDYVSKAKIFTNLMSGLESLDSNAIFSDISKTADMKNWWDNENQIFNKHFQGNVEVEFFKTTKYKNAPFSYFKNNQAINPVKNIKIQEVVIPNRKNLKELLNDKTFINSLSPSLDNLEQRIAENFDPIYKYNEILDKNVFDPSEVIEKLNPNVKFFKISLPLHVTSDNPRESLKVYSFYNQPNSIFIEYTPSQFTLSNEMNNKDFISYDDFAKKYSNLFVDQYKRATSSLDKEAYLNSLSDSLVNNKINIQGNYKADNSKVLDNLEIIVPIIDNGKEPKIYFNSMLDNINKYTGEIILPKSFEYNTNMLKEEKEYFRYEIQRKLEDSWKMPDPQPYNLNILYDLTNEEMLKIWKEKGFEQKK
ncbi:hypothetical protein [Mycoplasma seminis]|uniref:Lipoprotein n=1 Tax=Mycoplasma seminis TaxID=512749 RepID=A0ABY9HA27_9MOLU|nr:hypothetical protein [Mycoplasma seminis]WLP85392.1 hypothetical protein Q8852_03665 [Mycoplasma seminis]